MTVGGITKQAGEPTSVFALTGRLEGSPSGWLLLSVPNAIVRGLFDALDVAGAELPFHTDGKLNAHVSIMNADEVKQIGGIEKITERGKRFTFQLGDLKEVEPAGWAGMSRVWFCEVNSPELAALRRSYGLSSQPDGNKKKFHLTIARRRKKVLTTGAVVKQSAETSEPCIHGVIGPCSACKAENCPHCNANQEMGDNGTCNRCGKPWTEKAAVRSGVAAALSEVEDPSSITVYEKGDKLFIEVMDWARKAELDRVRQAAFAQVGEDNVDFGDEYGPRDEGWKKISRFFPREGLVASTKGWTPEQLQALRDLVKNRPAKLIPVKDLQVGSRSKRDGFGPVRYQKADQYNPVLVGPDRKIMDGRHRVAKVQDVGGENILGHEVGEDDLKSIKLSAAQELELLCCRQEAEDVGTFTSAMLQHWPELLKRAGEEAHWLPDANELYFGPSPGAGWIPLTSLHISKAAGWKESPLAQMVGGGLAAGALGYGGGALIENLFPERIVERGKLRRTLGTGGLLLGALPGAWAWNTNVNNARAGGEMQGVGGALKGLVTPTSKIRPTNAVYPGQYEDDALPIRPTTSIRDIPSQLTAQKLAAALKSFGGEPVVDNERLLNLRAAIKLANLDGIGAGLRSIPVDAFNNAIWNDVRKGMTAANNPYGTKSPWGDNSQELHTPPQLGVAAAGLVTGIQSLYGGTDFLTPRHFVNGLLAAGADLATARVVGSTLGALGGLTPQAQTRLQDMGVWGGLIRGTVGSLLGL